MVTPTLQRIIMNVSLLFCLLSILKYSRENVTSLSIKDALDLIPAGVCFVDSEGGVALKNLKMNEYCRDFTGAELNDADVFMTEISLVGRLEGGQWIADDGQRNIMFTEDEVEVEGEFYTELVASDVTEIFSLYRDTHNDIDSEIMRWKLSVRASIHREIGQTLCSSRFIKSPEERNPKALLRVLNNTSNIILKKSEPLSPKVDEWEYALELCEAGGIKVNIEGKVPESYKLKSIFARVLRECAANTVIHAGENSLFVRFRRDADSVTADFFNNGKPPKKPVSESGGLKTIRALVEEQGGRMNVLHSPKFTVQILIPI